MMIARDPRYWPLRIMNMRGRGRRGGNRSGRVLRSFWAAARRVAAARRAERWLERWNAGETLGAIASDAGVSRQCVQQRLNRFRESMSAGAVRAGRVPKAVRAPRSVRHGRSQYNRGCRCTECATSNRHEQHLLRGTTTHARRRRDMAPCPWCVVAVRAAALDTAGGAV